MSELFDARISEWYMDASSQTPASLSEFIKDVLESDVAKYGFYEYQPELIAICAKAAASAAAESLGGITGLQASAVNLLFIKNWYYHNNRCGLRILNYDDLLYPQTCYRFSNSIYEDAYKIIQDEVKKDIAKAESGEYFTMSQEVYNYWKNIANGMHPYGVTVIRDTDE